jgi:hypothetical protein
MPYRYFVFEGAIAGNNLVVHQCSAAPFNPALAEFTDSNHGELWTRST